MAIENRWPRAFQHMVAWVRQGYRDLMGPWHGLLKKKPSNPSPSNLEVEMMVARTLAPKNVAGALRMTGIDVYRTMRLDDISPFLMTAATEWAQLLAAELPELHMDPSRLHARGWLHLIDITSIFTKKNSIRVALEEFQATGETWRIEIAATAARSGIEAGASWVVAMDLAQLILGEADPQIKELRQQFTEDFSEFERHVIEAKPLLEEHGLGDGFQEVGTSQGVRIRALQVQYATQVNAELAPTIAEAQRIDEIQRQLRSLGAEVDWGLCRTVKRQYGIEDTPFNTEPGNLNDEVAPTEKERMGITNDIWKLWRVRLKDLAAERGELTLPHASTSQLILLGRFPSDRDTVAALEMLQRQMPSEVPLDLASAKCRRLDSSFYDQYRSATGDRPRGGRVLEATLASTDSSVAYISPHLSLAWVWPWETVVTLTINRKGRRFSRVDLTDDTGERYTISIGTPAMENLLAIYKWLGRT